MKNKKTTIFLALAMLFVHGASYAQNEALIKNLEDYTQQVIHTWQLPGMAVAFSKDGNLIYSKGFGHKEKRHSSNVGFKGSVPTSEITSGGVVAVVNENESPINSTTVFQIGSVSKSFTATLIASLIDEGKLSWEDTVKNILPDFKMYDPWVTENMQVKDIMTHRTGIGGQVGTYIPNLGYSRDDVYKMMGLIKPKYSFRGGYEYNNITFIIAEKIIEKITGKSWEENLKERIFEPLKMESTSANGDGFAQSKDVATPHDYRYKDGNIEALPLYGDEQALHWLTVVGPAGSINSTVEDMAKYAQMHNNNGWYAYENCCGGIDTAKIMSTQTMRKLHNGVTITSQTGSRTTLYAPCWFVEQNNKYRLYFHTGTTWGMTALCFFVPEIDFSGVILVNSEAGANLRYAIMRRGIDLILAEKQGKDITDAKVIDSLKDYNKEYFTEWIESFKKDDKEKTPVKELLPAPNEKTLIGKYEKDALFGNAEITLEKGELYITVGKKGYKNKLNHINGNEYEFRSDGHAFPIKFNMDEKGKKATGFIIEFNYGEENDFGGWTKK